MLLDSYNDLFLRAKEVSTLYEEEYELPLPYQKYKREKEVLNKDYDQRLEYAKGNTDKSIDSENSAMDNLRNRLEKDTNLDQKQKEDIKKNIQIHRYNISINKQQFIYFKTALDQKFDSDVKALRTKCFGPSWRTMARFQTDPNM